MTSNLLSNRDEVLEAAISRQNSEDTKMIELLEFSIKGAKEVSLTLPWYTILNY